MAIRPWRRHPSRGVNTLTGEGLAEALTGASRSRRRGERAFVEGQGRSGVLRDSRSQSSGRRSGRRRANISRTLGRRHRSSSPKWLLPSEDGRETLIKASRVPYTILRATQFFEFVSGIAQAASDGHTVRLSPAFVQPIGSDDVATALADLALEAPLNGTIELAGPEKIRLDELVRRYLAEHRDTRQVITDVHAFYFGTELPDQASFRRERSYRPDTFRGLAPPLRPSGVSHQIALDSQRQARHRLG